MRARAVTVSQIDTTHESYLSSPTTLVQGEWTGVQYPSLVDSTYVSRSGGESTSEFGGKRID